MPSPQIRAAVERNAGNPEVAVRELIEAANRAGGKDNVTVLVVEGEQFTAPAAARARGAAQPVDLARAAVRCRIPGGRWRSAGSRGPCGSPRRW